MSKLVFGSALASTIFGVLWTAVVTPFQWICITYVPPLQTLLSCPQVNFVYRWLEVPFLFVGVATLTYWASPHFHRFWTGSRWKRRALSLSAGTASAVIAIIFVSTFFTGNFAPGLSVGTNNPLASISGVITVNPQSGAGTLVLSVDNQGNVPIFALTITKITPSLATASSEFTFNGLPVNSSNPLPIGASAVCQCRFSSGGESGTQYEVFVSATFSDGSVVTGSAAIAATTEQST